MIIMACASSWASVPLLVNYQGKLSDTNGAPVTGNVTIDVAVYTNAAGGPAVYSENIGSVSVYQGLYSFTWGSQALLPHLLSAAALWQELVIDGEAMSPRQQLVAVPYALVAKTVEDGAITSDKLAAGAVTASALSAAAVTADAIAAGSVGSAQLASNAVTSASLADGSITAEKLDDSCIGFEQLATKYQAGQTNFDLVPGYLSEFALDYPRSFSSAALLMTSASYWSGDRVESSFDFTPGTITSNGFSGWIHVPWSASTDLLGIQTLISDNDTGLYPALVNDAYGVGIAYLDKTENALKYVSVDTENATVWYPPITLDTNGGEFVAAVMYHGNPSIAYYDSGNADLKYVSVDIENATTWTNPITLDSNGDVGRYASMTLFEDQPVVAYYDATLGDLKYVKVDQENGTVWQPPLALDTNGNVGQYTSMMLVSGLPAVSYYDETAGSLKYLRVDDANQTVWYGPATLDTNAHAGLFSSMAPGGRIAGTTSMLIYSYYFSWVPVHYAMWNPPIITYFCGNEPGLKCIRAEDANGTIWADPITLDAVNGAFCRAANICESHDGNMTNYAAISYYSADDQTLKYVRADDLNGTSWREPFTVDPNAGVGKYSALIDYRNHPFIAYYDEAHGDLKYAYNGTSVTVTVKWFAVEP